MIIVKCDMCDANINYDYNGVNCNFNHYGVVRFGSALNIKEEYQLCNNCAYRVKVDDADAPQTERSE